jgi:hypothetical protein
VSAGRAFTDKVYRQHYGVHMTEPIGLGSHTHKILLESADYTRSDSDEQLHSRDKDPVSISPNPLLAFVLTCQVAYLSFLENIHFFLQR